MNWLSIILLIIKYGPTIWRLVQEIIDMINGVSEYLPYLEGVMFKELKKDELSQAAHHYRKTRDKTKLEEMHGELRVQLSNFKNR